MQQGKKFYSTIGFKEVALLFGVIEVSYKKTSKWFNRICYQEEDVSSRTLQNRATKEGEQIESCIKDKTTDILIKNDFDKNGTPLKDRKEKKYILEKLDQSNIKDLLKKSDIASDLQKKILSNPVPYEKQTNCVYSSVDDVLVKKQKEIRKEISSLEMNRKNISVNDNKTLDIKPEKTFSKKKRVSVENRVIHIQQNKKQYIINGYGSFVFSILLAFLINNQLLGCNHVFFVDGNSLYSQISSFFVWLKNKSIILDWYHLQKRSGEILSMVFKAKQKKEEILNKMLYLLWLGLTDEAIKLLEKIPSDDICNQAQLKSMISYLKRNKLMIPSYEVRKLLGLRNSSGTVEKANDLIVSQRQKKNGMSWSKTGSVALASITSLQQNKEDQHWFKKKSLNFQLVA